MNPDTDSYPMVTCRECGETDQATYSNPTKTNMVERQLCFMCLFWTEHIEDRTYKFVSNGHHYHVLNEDSPSGMRGFGGRQYAIYPNEGERILTTNLWHQGEVPQRFRDRLPDNCTIIEVPRKP